jgi:hypothetical protein
MHPASAQRVIDRVIVHLVRRVVGSPPARGRRDVRPSRARLRPGSTRLARPAKALPISVPGSDADSGSPPTTARRRG